ncbi:MAG TPA: hypothetical protein PLF26_06095 [Blastocatellia bacterium]|nr:hypothetical protein [Blastocatellia bacterium]
MNDHDSDAADHALADEVTLLKTTLRSLVDELHGSAHLRATRDPARVDDVERELRRVVLRMVQIERDRIELRIARAL